MVVIYYQIKTDAINVKYVPIAYSATFCPLIFYDRLHMHRTKYVAVTDDSTK